MYQGDSFFTLGGWQQAGLLCVTIALSTALIWMVIVLTRAWPLWVQLAVPIVVLWLFIWLSPQIYYTYYLAIIDGLPLQSVIKTPPGVWTLLKTLGFVRETTLSAHGVGLLGWVLLISGATSPRWGKSR